MVLFALLIPVELIPVGLMRRSFLSSLYAAVAAAVVPRPTIVLGTRFNLIVSPSCNP